MLKGVYVDARSPDLLPLRAEAVALVLPPGAAVCRRTAAWLLGIDCRGPGEHTRVPEMECVVPVGTTPPRHPGVRAFVAPLPVCDIEVVMGVPRTTPSRTAIDLARWLPPFMGLGSVDAMAHAGLIDLRGVAVDLERWAGGRYVDQARRLITWAEPKTESFGESWLRLRLLEAGFPRPEAQIALGRPGARGGYRLDLGWAHLRLGVEYDGEAFHSSDEQRRHDEQRRDDLYRRWGWTVTGCNRADVLGRGMSLELAVGELLGVAPSIARRSW